MGDHPVDAIDHTARFHHQYIAYTDQKDHGTEREKSRAKTNWRKQWLLKNANTKVAFL